MLRDYGVPRIFPEDFFAVLGDDRFDRYELLVIFRMTLPKLINKNQTSKQNDRPDFMWLVIGPERSGSPFHIDPYKTSAWNAVLEGRKVKFCFFFVAFFAVCLIDSTEQFRAYSVGCFIHQMLILQVFQVKCLCFVNHDV